MKKKLLLVLLVLLLAAVAIVSFKKTGELEGCAFCSEDVLQRQAIYEDELVLALYSHKPIVPGHVLVIPKRHVERFEELQETEFLKIKEVIEKIDKAAQEIYKTSDYLLLQKNGQAAGQTVPHVHFHYFPRSDKDQVGPLFLLRFLVIPRLPPISQQEMKETIEQFQLRLK